TRNQKTMPSTTQEKKLSFKPRSSSAETRPDAPEGHWDFTIPKGGIKITKTQKEDPQISIQHKLTKAHDDKNEGFQGGVVTQRIIFFDDSDSTKVRGANAQKTRLRSLCEMVDVDYGEVYPTEIKDEDSFLPLIKALE